MYKISHVGVCVNDASKSSRFYQEILGFTVSDVYQDERVKLVYLDLLGQKVELVQFFHGDIQGERDKASHHIAFTVDDIETAIMRLRAAGVTLLDQEPRSLNGMQIVFFLGPDGEKLEFVCERTSRK